MKSLIDKLEDGSARIGVVGLGYVGLPLAMAFAKKFYVIGCDLNSKILECLRSGRSHILDVDDERVKQCLNRSLTLTNDYADLANSDFIIICVPTPLTEGKQPDLSYIRNACSRLNKTMKSGQFVILESTTYPGTTNDLVVPLLEESGLKAGIDFGVAYSPERVDPGNKMYKVENTPKIVGGISEDCTYIAKRLYEAVGITVVTVNDAKTAEAVKMVENIFRNVNIALVNELALIFEKMGINTWDVIDAAATKPYGFLPFYPGPGVGGHCIPLDPYYMSYISKKYGFIPRFIEIAGEINEFMKIHTINLVENGLKKLGKGLRGANVAVLGVSYKKNIDDIRESPAINIIEELIASGAQVRIYDPYVKSLETKAGRFTSEPSIEEALKSADCALFLIDHDFFRELDIAEITRSTGLPLIVDCKNLFEDVDNLGALYIGIGKANVI